ncbi:reverse transcriptase domain-containing protein [Tanacetum coccineum]
MRRCVAGNKIFEILAHCHSGPTRGHRSASIIGRKVYESGFFWPSIFKDAKYYVTRCDTCQRSRNISSRSEMPQNNIQMEHTSIPASTRKELRDGMTLGSREIKILKLDTRTVEITDRNEISFKVNGKRLKKYYDGRNDTDDKEVVEFKKNTT